MLLCHFKFSFKKEKLNFRFIGTLSNIQNRIYLETLDYIEIIDFIFFAYQ